MFPEIFIRTFPCAHVSGSRIDGYDFILLSVAKLLCRMTEYTPSALHEGFLQYKFIVFLPKRKIEMIS